MGHVTIPNTLMRNIAIASGGVAFVVGGVMSYITTKVTASNTTKTAKIEAEKYTNRLAAANNEASSQRSVNSCRRSNPARAYLLLRAGEFTKTSFRKPSYTTKISPQVLAILNCAATVRNDGVPVELPKTVQDRYLELFSKRLVPTTRENKIIGVVPFKVYFSAKGPPNP